MSYIGTTKVGGMYIGGTKVAKAYLGNDLVYEISESGEVVARSTDNAATAAFLKGLNRNGYSSSELKLYKTECESVTSLTGNWYSNATGVGSAGQDLSFFQYFTSSKKITFGVSGSKYGWFIIFPSSITSFPDYTFDYLYASSSSPLEVVLLGTTPPYFSPYCFATSRSAFIDMYVPDDSYNDYITATSSLMNYWSGASGKITIKRISELSQEKKSRIKVL